MKLINDFGHDATSGLHNLSLLLLRVAFGVSMIIGHGYPKFLKLTGDAPIQFMNFMGLGESFSLTLVVFAEVVCAILLILGLFTRYAVIPLIITMLVAFFMVHFNDPFQKMEGSLLYLVAYLVILIQGAGRFSMDYLIWSKR